MGFDRWRRVACYFPLLALAVHLVWCVVVTVVFIVSVGDEPYVNTPEKQRVMDVVFTIPAALGFAGGVVASVCLAPRTALQWACLVGGSLLCLSAVWYCLWA